MPTVPVIDTHLHLWDPNRIAYSWQTGNALLKRIAIGHPKAGWRSANPRVAKACILRRLLSPGRPLGLWAYPNSSVLRFCARRGVAPAIPLLDSRERRPRWTPTAKSTDPKPAFDPYIGLSYLTARALSHCLIDTAQGSRRRRDVYRGSVASTEGPPRQ